MCIPFRGSEVRVLTVHFSKRYYLSDKLVSTAAEREDHFRWRHDVRTSTAFLP